MSNPQVMVIILSIVVPMFAGIVVLFFKLTMLHKQMNSRMDDLLSVTRTQALAEGHLAGVVEGETTRRKQQDDKHDGAA